MSGSQFSSLPVSSSNKTRKSQRHFVFGHVAKLPTNVLPTIGQVAQYFLFLKERPKSGNESVVLKIAEDVVKVWHLASIPTVQKQTVVNRVRRIVSTGSQLCRSKSSTRKRLHFASGLKKLFDICTCMCPLTLKQDSNEVVATCRCSRDQKVPERELKFLYDQRSARKMYIGGVDKATTTKVRKLKARKEEERLRQQREEHRKTHAEVAVSEYSSYEEGDEEEGEEEMKSLAKEGGLEDVTGEPKEEEEEEGEVQDMLDHFTDTDDESDSDAEYFSYSQEHQLRMSLPNLVREADRFGVSDRAAAALATAVLKDFGLVSDSDRSNVIDKSKIRRERQKLRENLERSLANQRDITGLYFDGRKDDTLMKRKESGKWYTCTDKEEHYVLVSEPGSQYLAHVSPKSSKSKDIADSIMMKVNELGIEADLRVIGCDSANINTGFKGGVVQYVENALARPLQWCICLLHTNELPLRHLFITLDGGTTGANTFAGTIGNSLQSCEKMPVIKFQRIAEGEDLPQLSANSISGLSRDQQYLYRVVQSIRQGHISEDLARQKPGRLSHSRWLTLANRICRLYVASAQPNINLQYLAHFVVTFYSVMWFSIRQRSSFLDGPKHVFLATQLLKVQQPVVRDIIKPYIARNAYFAHPENILVSLMSDESSAKRKKAVQIVLKIRKNKQSAAPFVRQFKVPNINFNATDWDDLIEWDEVVLSEPPLTAHLTNVQIKNITNSALHLPCYPNHTQSVERYIREVTEASNKVYGADSRHGYVVARLASRNKMPQFDTKKQFDCI